MLQPGDGARFSCQPGPGFMLAGQVRVEHLHRHLPLQRGVESPVDDRHSARAEGLKQPIPPQVPTLEAHPRGGPPPRANARMSRNVPHCSGDGRDPAVRRPRPHPSNSGPSVSASYGSDRAFNPGRAVARRPGSPGTAGSGGRHHLAWPGRSPANRGLDLKGSIPALRRTSSIWVTKTNSMSFSPARHVADPCDASGGPADAARWAASSSVPYGQDSPRRVASPVIAAADADPVISEVSAVRWSPRWPSLGMPRRSGVDVRLPAGTMPGDPPCCGGSSVPFWATFIVAQLPGEGHPTLAGHLGALDGEIPPTAVRPVWWPPCTSVRSAPRSRRPRGQSLHLVG